MYNSTSVAVFDASFHKLMDTNMKLVIATAFLFATTCVQARNACDVELEGGLRITNAALEFTEGDHTRYKILNDQALIMNERAVNLNPKQQLLVKQYASGIRALVPEVHQLTIDGVDLASQAMDLVFQELLEPDNKTAQKVHTEFLLLKNDIEKGFASGKPININQKGLQDNDYLGMDFETRISKIADASGREISWNLIKSLGAAIFSSDDKRGDFETRMNKFGDRMEREMNARAGKMEQLGSIVCASVAALDRKEEELKLSITEINSFNLIKLKNVSQ